MPHHGIKSGTHAIKENDSYNTFFIIRLMGNSFPRHCPIVYECVEAANLSDSKSQRSPLIGRTVGLIAQPPAQTCLARPKIGRGRATGRDATITKNRVIFSVCRLVSCLGLMLLSTLLLTLSIATNNNVYLVPKSDLYFASSQYDARIIDEKP